MSTSQDLDKVIPVDNPMEPDNQGFLKAYIENYYPASESINRTVNQETGELNPLPYNIGLKENIPKLNIETGELLNFDGHDAFINNDDFRVISIQTAHRMGLNFGNQEETKDLIDHVHSSLKMSTNSSLERYLSNFEKRLANPEQCDFTKSSYYQASINNGYLVCVDKITDHSFLEALDACAKANFTPQIGPNDAKFEAEFNKLDQYFKKFNVELNYLCYQDFDMQNEDFKVSNSGKAFLYNDNDRPYSNNNSDPFRTYLARDFSQEDRNIYYCPAPFSFKSENDYLKAAAHVISNHILNSQRYSFNSNTEIDLKLNSQEKEFLSKHSAPVYEMAGTMLASQFGVPFTQNDINRFNVHFSQKACPQDELKQVHDLAIRVVNYVKELDLSKDVIKHDNASERTTLWQDWKSNNERYAMQMATPSFSEIAEHLNKNITQNNIKDAVSQFCMDKAKSFQANKEQIKETLKDDIGLNKSSVLHTISQRFKSILNILSKDKEFKTEHALER